MNLGTIFMLGSVLKKRLIFVYFWHEEEHESKHIMGPITNEHLHLRNIHSVNTE